MHRPVADRGMFGEANLKTMEERDLQYIVGARLNSLPKDLKERILDLDAYKPTGGSDDSLLAEFKHKCRRIVVGWSRKRAGKDAADRKKAVDKLIRKLGQSANPAQALSARWDGLKGVAANAPDMYRICRTLGLPMSRTPYWIE